MAMTEAKLMREDSVLIVIASTAVEESDFERLRLLVDPYIEKYGTLNGLLIYIESPSVWADLSSMLSYFKFIDEHRQKIKRVAAVTDSSLLSMLPWLSDYFVDAEVRHFTYEDHLAALTWLKTGTASLSEDTDQ